MQDELDKLLVLEEFYGQKLWFLDLGGDQRVYAASIKVEPSGYLLILRARSAEGPQVAFVGARSLSEIRRKVLGFEGNSTLKWQADKFALDGLGES